MQNEGISSLLKRPIAFHPILAKLFGGINEAIYWQQLHYWSDKGKREDGYIYKTKEEIEEETTLTRDQQDRARKNLETDGYLKTKLIKANGTPTLHYLVDFRLVENQLIEKRETSLSMEKRETSDSLTESTQRDTTRKLKLSPFYKSFVQDLPKEEVKRLKEKINCTEGQIELQKEEYLAWVDQFGVKVKNYQRGFEKRLLSKYGLRRKDYLNVKHGDKMTC